MSFRQFVIDFGLGFRDSLYGFWAVWFIDSELEEGSGVLGSGGGQFSSLKSQPGGRGGGAPSTVPMTTLARRRQLSAAAAQQSDVSTISTTSSAGSSLKSSSEKGVGDPMVASVLVPSKPVNGARKRVLSCCAMNVVLFVGLEYLLKPACSGVFSVLFRAVGGGGGGTAGRGGGGKFERLAALSAFLAQTLWILPLFTTSRIVNLLWFQDVANASARKKTAAAAANASIGGGAFSTGRSPARKVSAAASSGTSHHQQSSSAISVGLADFFLAILLELLFLLQASLVHLVPMFLVADGIKRLTKLVSFGAYILHLCLLYALYSFEYCWMEQSEVLSTRIARIELDWPYYMGFGAVLTAVHTATGSYLLSSCLFGMLFPFFIVSGYEAAPVTPSVGNVRLHIFAPSKYLCNKISYWCNRRALYI